MPIVVRMAISDAINSTHMTTRSTRLRARKSGRTRKKAKAPPAKASKIVATMPISP